MSRVRTIAVVVLCACGRQGGDPATAPPGGGAGLAATGGASDPAGGESWTLKSLARGAVLFGDLGDHERPVTTQSPQAQAFFDQGLNLLYGFNHDEAARSFARAVELDPSCAMCLWGVAYALGPNYNIPMLPDRAHAAWDAVTRAQEHAQYGQPVEAALVAALARRFKGSEYAPPTEMEAYNRVYAVEMRDVARRFPDDLDVQALFAEALMNVNPWRLWSNDGVAAPGTLEIVETLESVLARDESHPGANHFYIHAVEASPRPERAVAAAERLAALMPGAGHMVHMPAHIYQRVGRYGDAAEANRRAVQVDARYLARVEPIGYYPLYLAHNYGFLAYAASMQGRSAESLEAARKSAEHMPRDVVCGMPGMDFFLSEPLLVMVRFGRWDEVFGASKPDPKHQTLVALWHHARGMALAATDEVEAAYAEAMQIRDIMRRLPEDQLAGLNQGRRVLQLAADIVEARAAQAERSPETIARWERAVTLADTLAYNEPADWFYPVRHYLGAALLDAGRAREAEAVYRADLAKNPNNGWAYFGLWKSLAAQKKKSAARKAERDYLDAWAFADFELERTAF
ncbi:hypothetical protein SAMN02745121_04060 [Nannocystis exedens]|uniref:Tetratricopeptide repeat-containing protein n=1 Tax=Nannocystis exedens TaxID=54 RepID=A0A1I2A7N9_9BACT|nr:tetratricopeptide repeat protein [Nannocystis exedens]PCC69636.1 Tetratricopeptide repeat protein [Nannocystis exedens]SFE38820.1 hypothetical protein SAMN02745121_04060 [Nannocystis exedens]